MNARQTCKFNKMIYIYAKKLEYYANRQVPWPTDIG